MSTLTFELPARRPHRVARPVVHRRPQVVPVPVFDERERALTLVREALSHTELMVAISHAAPPRYTEFRAMTRPLGYRDPARPALAENLAVEGLLDLGIVAVHNRAREITNELEAAKESYRTSGGSTLFEWQASEYWGGPRRLRELGDLEHVLIGARIGRDWDLNPGHAPAMPQLADATRYTVAPGITATADELVAAVYGYWLCVDDEREISEPLMSGEVHTWFRRLAAKLFTVSMADYGYVTNPDVQTIADGRARALGLEFESLTRLLEQGDERYEGIDSVRVHRFAMRPDDRARLRFIEIHLSAAFGFTGHDARARRARMDIAGAERWPF